MGVTGFWDYTQKYATKVDPSELQDKVLTIDGHTWLFETPGGRSQNQGEKSFLLTFYKRCLTLRKFSIEPIIVFDKIPLGFDQDWFSSEPGLKILQKKRLRRSGPTNGWSTHVYNDLTARVNLVKDLMNAMGIRVVEGGADGDAQCAQLEDTGISNGCITSDMDYFLFGGKDIYKIDFAQGGSSISSVQHLSMSKLESLSLNRNRLIALSIMLGCNYVEGGIDRVGMISALEILSEFSYHEDDHPISILDRFATYVRGELPVRTTDSDRKQKIRGSSIALPIGFPNTDVYIEASCLYFKPRVEPLPPVLPPGTLDFKAVSTILQRECSWTPKRMSIASKPKRSTSQTKQAIMPNFFSSTRRRSQPVVETCSQEDRNKCSQREWAALEKLRQNTALYDVEDNTKCDTPTTSSSRSPSSGPPNKRAKKIIVVSESKRVLPLRVRSSNV